MNLDVDVSARLIALLENAERRQQRVASRRQQIAAAISQVPLVAPQMTAAAGTIDSSDQLKAKTGFYWSIRRLALTGFTAGTATVYVDAVGGEPVAVFPTAGVQFYSKSAILINPESRLVVSASGITGFVQLNGRADCFPSWMLPYYLGIVTIEDD